ncbi:MAG TPA: hypothetical protein VG711_10755 [Phycisphaerales bacterium]|nr:hypothetical protein [Phycisphaerales bacterium]
MQRKLFTFVAVLVAVVCAICTYAYLHHASGPYVVELEKVPDSFTEELATDAAHKAMEARGYSQPSWAIKTVLVPYDDYSGTGGFRPWDPAKHKAGFFIMGQAGGPSRLEELCIIDVKLEGKVITCVIRPQTPSK